jgi:hypothetical protein
MTFTVRDWTIADTELEVEWFAEDRLLWQYMPGFEQAPTAAEIRLHMQTRLDQRAQGRALVLAIDGDGRLAGQFVLFPFLQQEGSAHILVAPWAHGHGVAIFRAGVVEAQARGVRKIIGIPSARLPLDVYERFLRRVGFTIRFYGEITT